MNWTYVQSYVSYAIIFMSEQEKISSKFDPSHIFGLFYDENGAYLKLLTIISKLLTLTVKFPKK